MTITTYLLSKLDFGAPKRWLAGKAPSAPTRTDSSFAYLSIHKQSTTISVARPADRTHANVRNAHQPKPLRVVHVVEQGQPRQHVGRMVISGRMADVCAELDRLAACEPA
jgi:hypothetical protein